MAFVLKDRVKQITDTTGTGALSVTSVSTGYQTFSDAIGNGNTTYYAIYHENTVEWEVGIGTVGSGTLSRDTVLASSNSGSLVNFTNGNKAVWCDYPAGKSVYLDPNGDVSETIRNVSGITGAITSPDYIGFDTTYATTLGVGQLGWDGNNTLGLGMAGGNVVQKIGEDQFFYCKATSAITKGQVVMFTGAVGASGVPTGAPATGVTDGTYIMGVAAESIAHNGFGLVQTFGTLKNVNTSGYADGDILWYNPSVTGGMTTTKPSAPNVKVQMAAVINGGSAGGGTILIRIDPGSVLGGTDANVQITSPTTGQSLIYDSGTGIWTNGNNEVINGGTINNTPIGATTPSTGAFTTLTAQTEVLKGTGQNLLTYSNTFTNGAWITSNATINTTSATTDPVGGLNAFILTSSSTTSSGISQTVTLATNTYTASIYAKAGTSSFLRFIGTGAGFPAAWFNLSNGTVGTVQAGITATSIQAIGNGWYRCSVTSTGSASPLFRFSDSDNSSIATSGTYLYIYGSQLELGSTANTYIPTTTTAIYGTPSLSFSGVAGIGLESNGSLYHQPAGTGAVQAQATTSSATGGNVRGANAVDWQTSRGSAGQVASQSFSTISGGQSNTANGFYSTIAGGLSNNSNSSATFVGAGQSNTVSSQFSSVVGGYANTSGGSFNFVGGGYSNSGTASATVTTQATTTVTSGSTAVTLSGSNANIKVGQLITGTGIVSFTYVSAISGTSLTLSQNANASGSPTLSFYTPHGVVVGGGNNQATGSYSFIGGGGDAGTAANRNVASGDWSVVCGGAKNTASAIGAFIGGGGVDSAGTIAGNTASASVATIVAGRNNTVTGIYGFIGGGSSNGVSNQYSVVAGGYTNNANGQFNFIGGGAYGTARGIIGSHVSPACFSPISSAAGVSQAALLILARQTTDATATVICSDSGSAGTTNQVILPNNSAYYFKGEVVAGVTGGGNTKGWFIEGVIKRGANAASTALVGTPTVTSNYADAGASTWTVAAAADTTNGGLKITVTGQAATTIRWVAQVRTTEMTF